jgi:hypothetical protein
MTFKFVENKVITSVEYRSMIPSPVFESNMNFDGDSAFDELGESTSKQFTVYILTSAPLGKTNIFLKKKGEEMGIDIDS